MLCLEEVVPVVSRMARGLRSILIGTKAQEPPTPDPWGQGGRDCTGCAHAGQTHGWPFSFLGACSEQQTCAQGRHMTVAGLLVSLGQIQQAVELRCLARSR